MGDRQFKLKTGDLQSVGTRSFIDPYVFDSSTYSLSSPVAMNDIHITASLRSALATHVSLFPTVSQDDNEIVPAWSWRSSHETSHQNSETVQSVHYEPASTISPHDASTLRQQLWAYLSSTGQPVMFAMTAKAFVIDTGTSITITNSLDDFQGPLLHVPPMQLKGIVAGLMVQGMGSAVYKFCSDNDEIVALPLKNILYVLERPVRLLCPRHLAENTDIPTNGFTAKRDNGMLTLENSPITVSYNSQTGLPIVLTIQILSACFIATAL